MSQFSTPLAQVSAPGVTDGQAHAGERGLRIERASGTVLAVVGYGSCIIGWDDVSTPAAALAAGVSTFDELMNADATLGPSLPAASTLYYVYLRSTDAGQGIKLSATAPTDDGTGVLVLGTGSAEARRCLFLGWVYLDGATEFVDTESSRTVVNYFNRLRKPIFACPEYVDDDADTRYSSTSSDWAPINGGVGDSVIYIGNGEDAVLLQLSVSVSDYNATTGFVGIESVTGILACAVIGGDDACAACSAAVVAPADIQTATIVANTNTGMWEVVADAAHGSGTSADVPATSLWGTVWC